MVNTDTATATDTVKVYRVEDPETTSGPYRVNNSFYEGVDDDTYPFRDVAPVRPGPYHDDGLMSHGPIPPNYPFVAFGFANRKQLDTWFNKPRKQWLKDHSFAIRVFEVPADKVLRGTRQVVFDRTAAKLIATEPIELTSTTRLN